MAISEKNKVLINRVIDTIDWDLIFRFYKLVGRSVGAETTQIQGIKKLEKGTKLSNDHVKEEVRNVISHVVENDISEFMYGPWNVIWVNGEWEAEIPETDENGKEIEGGESQFVPILESLLEVHFSPMVVISKEVVKSIDEDVDQSTLDLQKQLDKAIDDENYELASKIRDLIDIYNKQK